MRFLIITLLLLAHLFCPATEFPALAQQEPMSLPALEQATREAAKLFAAGEFLESAEKISEIQQRLGVWIKSATPLQRRQARGLYGRLARAHALLELEGAELEPLPGWDEWAEPDQPSEPATATVSFQADIAPILLENCNGCHIAGRQASGNLRMDTFEQLLRGGDSGALVDTQRVEESLLLQKLRGQAGQRMPAGGRPPLKDEQIELIAAWIKEGAVFDGSSPTSNLESIASQAWAAEASHEELFQRRQARAMQRWNRVLPNDSPATASDESYFVLGNISPASAEKVLQRLSAAEDKVRKSLRLDKSERLIDGGLVIFALKSRYDYSEFGRMTESRELPKEWLGHWRAEPLDVYGVIASDDSIEEEQAESLALHIVAGAYMGSLSDVPPWFAEGVARNLVLANYRRGDPRVMQWQRGLPAALQRLDKPETLLEGRLDDEAAGLVGLRVAAFMLERQNRGRFEKLHQALREGVPFDSACAAAFLPPEALVKAWISK